MDRKPITIKKIKSVQVVELLLIFALSIVTFIVAGHFDILERMVDFTRQHEHWQMDELIPTSIFLAIAFGFFSIHRWLELIISERKLKHQNIELQKAFDEIKRLKGILPICSSCKKIRDDDGYWHQVESYIRNHSEAEFSHGICPDCMRKLYPDLIENDE